MTEMRDPNSLIDHPLNRVVFSEPNLSDVGLLEDIRANGVENPIHILPVELETTDGITLPENTIIRGHRRKHYAIAVGLSQVPVVIRHDLVEAGDIELSLLRDNDQKLMRTLTHEQRTKMAMWLEDLEKSRRRRLERDGEKFDCSKRPEEVAAKTVGMSRQTYRSARETVKVISKAEEKGDGQTAEDLRQKLNRSVSWARRVAVQNKPSSAVPSRLSGKAALGKVDEALRALSRSVMHAEKATGGPGMFSRSMVEIVNRAKSKLAEWKDDL